MLETALFFAFVFGLAWLLSGPEKDLVRACRQIRQEAAQRERGRKARVGGS